MPERYNMVFRLPPRLYLEGSPVIIEAGAIQKDTQTNKLLVQLKFRNISSKTMIACKVKINAYSVSGDQLEGVESFSYLDLNVYAGEEFGTKTPIYLPNYETRKITVFVTQIVFSDNSVWDSDGGEWVQIDEPVKIERKLLEEELIKQYKIEAGNLSDYYPEIKNGLFYCTCGSVNAETAERCYYCKKSYAELVELLDEEYLIDKCNERLEQERTKLENARIAERRALEQRRERAIAIKKVMKIVAIAVAVLVVVATIIAYFVNKNNDYKRADKLYDSGNYLKAESDFESLGNFRDSDTRVLQCRYMLGDEAYDNGDYSGAEEYFSSLGDYSDSVNRVLQCRYSIGIEAYEEGDYSGALEIFEALGDYDNSPQMVETINSAIEVSESIQNVRAVMSHSVVEAYSLLCEMDSNNTEVQELLHLCRCYTPYCGNYFWSVEGFDISFYSDFGINDDGTVYWIYDSDDEVPSYNGQRYFLSGQEVMGSDSMYISRELEPESGYTVTVVFENGGISTFCSWYEVYTLGSFTYSDDNRTYSGTTNASPLD